MRTLACVSIIKASHLFQGVSMSRYIRSNRHGGTFFFTVVSYKRRKILCEEIIRSALHQAIVDVRKIHPFNINAWVLLPDHLHCILTLPPHDSSFGIRWSLIKRIVTQQCPLSLITDSTLNQSQRKRRESVVWQRRFWEHEIKNNDDYEKHFNYVHYNPVKHGLVDNLKDWPYSTFHRYVEEGVYECDWGTNDVIINGKFGE